MSEPVKHALRICPFCEATCGLSLEVVDRTVTAVRGDAEDVFSQGFICPKGVAIAELDADPDRLRQPLVRHGERFVEVSWDEAFAEIERRLAPILRENGKDSVAAYLGNPTVHNLALSLYGQVLLRALRSKNIYSASTVDQIPKQLASALMFGTYTSVAVPDIERCDLLWILGADPYESNGSLWTVPDFPRRMRELQQRGGRCVVFDPRRSRTAQAADEHYFIRPGTDALFLMAVIHCLFQDGLVAPGRLGEHVAGLDRVRELSQGFSPDQVAAICGIGLEEIRNLARSLAAAPRAAVYGRIGTCTQEFGTATSWLIDVCNVLTGNLDRPGGVMFPKAAAFASNTYGPPGQGSGVRVGRRRSRVRNAPEVMGEFPVGCLAEEIETPGEGQVRALFVVAGNPVLSTPDGARLGRALAQLDLMVSLDIYLNETSRYAHVILPGLSPLEQPHYDAIFPQFGYRNAVRFSSPVFPPAAERPTEWQTLLRLTGILTGQGASADLEALDDFVAMTQIQKTVDDPHSPAYGRTSAEILEALAPRRGPERLLDLSLRTGPYGDGFGALPDGLTLSRLEAAPHGVDLGELRARVPEALRTPSGRVELAPDLLVADVERLKQKMLSTSASGLRLIGRRHLRSNNSWLHNLPKLAAGRERCTLLIHPDDARARGVAEGGSVRVVSKVGSIVAKVELSAVMMQGVVSLPHGWGHDASGTRLQVAARRPGVNSNFLADGADVDPVSGNAVLNGIAVEIEPLG